MIQADPLFVPALLLILLGAFTKSAQFPFHFWLPDAMAAPTPVSAYLHSATMVKAGVFLLMRMYPVLAGSGWFEVIVTVAGLATVLFAAFIALFKHDLKGLLAYSTVSHLGLIVFLIGLGSPLAAVAAVFHVLNHATFKASLFMIAGIVDHETHSRDMRQLGGLYKLMPWTATLSMVAAASMAGVPLTNGFLSKERRQAGQLPEHHQQQQVVRQRHTQHGRHEQHHLAVELARRVLGAQVEVRVEHDQQADEQDQPRKQQGETIQPERQVQPDLGHPGPGVAHRLARHHRRRMAQQHGQTGSGDRAGRQGGQQTGLRTEPECGCGAQQKWQQHDQ
jgi:hypothetical protein